MTLIRRISTAARTWWPQGCVVALGIGGGLIYTAVAEPVYTAQAYVVVVAENQTGIEQATNFAQAFTRIATQPGILATALRPGLPAKDVSQLQRVVRVAASPDAPLISLTASAPQPAQASGQANAVAQALITYAKAHTADTGVRIAALSQASPPAQPSSPNRLVNVTVGGAAGLLVGGLFYLVSPPARQRPRRPRERAGKPVKA
ncbi:MAG: lipopolysaccharide biosynthesis protein [Nonomuraea sp.]|nr:lipopolysaccharide biosynthesis protein [Nonomuraea sp.]